MHEEPDLVELDFKRPWPEDVSFIQPRTRLDKLRVQLKPRRCGNRNEENCGFEGFSERIG